MTTSLSLPRPPRQERTREGWARILSVGLELLESGGWDALTIAEVCRRARVSAPSIYARVDGRAGLFDAVYEHGMLRVQATEREQFGLLPAEAAEVGDVVGAFVRVFLTHEAFLRAVIRHSASSPELLARGSQEAQRITATMAGALPVEHELGTRIARVIFSECVIRVMYGAGFYTEHDESPSEFVDTLTSIATGLIASQPASP